MFNLLKFNSTEELTKANTILQAHGIEGIEIGEEIENTLNAVIDIANEGLHPKENINEQTPFYINKVISISVNDLEALLRETFKEDFDNQKLLNVEINVEEENTCKLILSFNNLNENEITDILKKYNIDNPMISGEFFDIVTNAPISKLSFDLAEFQSVIEKHCNTNLSGSCIVDIPAMAIYMFIS